MKRMEWSTGWRFKYGPGGAGTNPDEQWSEVNLPHDAGIALQRVPDAVGGGSNAFYPGAVCWYEKELDLSDDAWGKSWVLEVEGAYMNALVTVNRNIAGRRPYGYSSFHCDLSPWLVPGKNLVRVEVSNGGLANTRWYSGSGLYRPVRLLEGGPVRMEPWSLRVMTPAVEALEGQANAEVCVRNATAEPVAALIRFDVRMGEQVCASALSAVNLPAGGFTKAMVNLPVPGITAWTPETPVLYTLRAEVLQGGVSVDREETVFGFRTVEVDGVDGFRLNGVARKLRGGCVHHDCGLLGAAAFARAEERKVERLKASGFDAVRCAHNPPSPAFLDACDRLGMLVIDEAFDCWRHGKNPGDYNLWFEDWWERDLTDMVRRDFNHPSVVMWSTGNEIIERDGRSSAAAQAVRMADLVRKLDPTRPVTHALCDLWEERNPEQSQEFLRQRFMDKTTGFAAPLDVVGWNYLLPWYDEAAGMYPGRAICGTETFPKDAFDYWEAVERLPNVIGDFVWTSMDYLGEAGIGHVKEKDTEPFLKPFPWHHANCGDIDICGTKRPQSHYRDCVWGIATAPYIAVHAPERHGKTGILSPWGWPEVSACWNWAGWEEKPCQVDVYSMADEVALFLDGVELERKPAGKAHKHLASFETVYRPGRLEAVEYHSGKETARTVLETAGPAASIRLSADRVLLEKGTGDLSFVKVELLDAQGRLATQADNRLYFTAHGAGRVLAVGNGDPASEEAYVGTTRKAWHGLATAVVLATAQGKAILTVTGEGLVPASVEIFVG